MYKHNISFFVCVELESSANKLARMCSHTILSFRRFKILLICFFTFIYVLLIIYPYFSLILLLFLKYFMFHIFFAFDRMQVQSGNV